MISIFDLFLFFVHITISVINLFSPWQMVKRYFVQSSYQRKAKRQRNKRDQIAQNLTHTVQDTIPKEFERVVLNASVPQLKVMLDQKKFTSVQLLNFYTLRSATIGVDLELVTEFNYTEALEQAKKCDTLREESPEQVRGELFGVVMSVKDSFNVKGMVSSCGLINRIEEVEHNDGFVIQVLKNAGAIIFVKTNVPQIMLTYDTQNYIYGTAKNPWNRKRAAGGSTGGGSGLIAAKCTPLEFGTDIGGSIRLPSHFCGISGLKPSFSRQTSFGHNKSSYAITGRQLTVGGCVGPMGRYVDDLTLTMKALFNKENRQQIPRQNQPSHFVFSDFNQELLETNRKLKIGYYKTFENIPSATAVQRSVDEAVAALRSRGHEVVPVDLPDFEVIDSLYKQLVLSDIGVTFRELLKGERQISLYSMLMLFTGIPKFFQKLIIRIAVLLGEKRQTLFMSKFIRSSNYDYQKTTGMVVEKRQKYVEFFCENNFDAIIGPGFGIPAGYHGFAQQFMAYSGYNTIWNVLDFPSGVVPITVVKEYEQTYKDKFNDKLTREVQKHMKNSAGMPLGVQVICIPNQEEMCLNIMKQLEETVKFHTQFQIPQSS